MLSCTPRKPSKNRSFSTELTSGEGEFATTGRRNSWHSFLCYTFYHPNDDKWLNDERFLWAGTGGTLCVSVCQRISSGKRVFSSAARIVISYSRRSCRYCGTWGTNIWNFFFHKTESFRYSTKDVNSNHVKLLY